MSFVDELRTTPSVNTGNVENFQNRYVNDFILALKEECIRRKSERSIEGYFRDNCEFDGIGLCTKDKLPRTTVRKVYNGFEEELQKINTHARQIRPLLEAQYNIPVLKSKISTEMNNLGFTNFELDFIKVKQYLATSQRTFLWGFKDIEKETERFYYILYFKVSW